MPSDGVTRSLPPVRWDRWSEEAYEGWGWDDAHPPNSHGVNASIVSPVPPELAAAVAAAADGGGEKDDEDLEYGYAERGNSTFGAIFRRPGVVYPIHPTGHLRLPRPKRPFGGLADAGGGGDGQGQGGVGENKKREEVIFVVQVSVGGSRARALAVGGDEGPINQGTNATSMRPVNNSSVTTVCAPPPPPRRLSTFSV